MAFTDVKRIHVEMSLREPLFDALKALDKTLRDVEEYGTSLDNLSRVEAVTHLKFQTQFPSFSFHIATGVGKTRLLGACIAYLYRVHGLTDFFILVPGSTIYNKFKGSDFVRGGPKFIFAGLADFPDFNLVTADNYRNVLQTGLFDAPINIYLYNISKIFESTSREKTFKFSKIDADGMGLEYENGFASYLAKRRPVILMDEAHRYYAPASLNAMNRLQPSMGLEFTATPTFGGNIISHFNLGQAIDKGYVKHPRVARIINDTTPESEKEQATLLDAVRNHERKKAALAAYCANSGKSNVTPVLLVTTEDTSHGDRVAAYLEGKTEFIAKGKDGKETVERLYDGRPLGEGTLLEGRYANKVLLVHSKTEEDTDQAIKTLETNEYEIVVHVNKLKEGLDVSTIYTLAVLRASKANVLTEQIIGRGLRLPFGELVDADADIEENVNDLNALDIMPHKEYQRVIDEADDYLKGRIQERSIDRSSRSSSINTYDTVTVDPLPNPELQIEIPLINSTLSGLDRRLTPFIIKPGRAIMPDNDDRRRMELDNIFTRKATLVEELGSANVTNGVAYLVGAVLERCSETDADDAEVIASCAHKYLEQLWPDESKWPYAIALRRKPILDDFTAQIKAKLDELHPVVQVRRTGTFSFKAWTKNVPQGYVIPMRQDNDPSQEKSGVLIGGYIKSIYPINYFDSKSEKFLADCLERDETVLRWVRLPRRQLKIGLSRTGYYPDFVAVVKLGANTSIDTGSNNGDYECYYLLEIKAENKCDPLRPDPDVKRKYDVAMDWTAEANAEADIEGQRGGGSSQSRWYYRLLSDVEVERRRTGDFAYIIDGARAL
ncbi:MAG: DEAD/DEAH box helicase family protein [Chloroflexota bacterium]|nr:DEAD/DEAH box helicase family protein [Chloroflexota bacterium]